MRNLLGNRWGKIGLMLVMCFEVYGVTATMSHAQTVCCNCENNLWYDQVSGSCEQTCILNGSQYNNYNYTRRSGVQCGSPCSNINSMCKSTTQVICWDNADHTINKTTLCLQNHATGYFYCAPGAGIAGMEDDANWDPCPDTAEGVAQVCCEWGGNWNEDTNTLLSDDSCDCKPNPYAPN